MEKNNSVIIPIRTLFGINRITKYGDNITVNFSEPFGGIVAINNEIQLSTQTHTNCVYNILRVLEFSVKKEIKRAMEKH